VPTTPRYRDTSDPADPRLGYLYRGSLVYVPESVTGAALDAELFRLAGTGLIPRLYAAVSAVCPVETVSVAEVGDPDSVTLSYGPGVTDEQKAAALSTVGAFDWSNATQAAFDLAARRMTALTSFFSRDDDTAIAVRAFFTAVIFLMNNRFESLGQTRVLATEILAFIQANPTIGDPSE
jgi:hypothetical protein